MSGMRPRWETDTPMNLHPLVKFLFQAARESKRSALSIEKCAGVSSQTIASWYNGHKPRVDNLEACLNVLGYQLKIVPIDTVAAE